MKLSRLSRTLLFTAALGGATLTLSQCAAPLILAGGAVGIGYYLGSERRDTDTIAEDSKAEQQMIEAMRDAGIDINRVTVTVYNHKMLLIGRLPSEDQVAQLTRLARNIPYVTKVYNRVKVGPPLSDSQATEDGLLAAKVKAALVAEKGLNSASLHFDVYDGTVYLMGLVTQEEARKAIAAVSGVKGVRKVIDAMDRL
ncbi:BON domain-containing protein [Sulfurivirga sp.]|uniref:BON domain-containing protein n=1 Tax=Sulfurivirga sp. TaxID=2614236 RepID=UPI0025F42B44|nr:BON domain-containing protein [Sulfurivirga sp.]